MSEKAFSAVDVHRHFEGGAVRALDGLTLDIDTGERVAIVGPSGSGKTTLLNLMGALDVPTSGRMVIQGTELAAGADLDDLRAREIGFIFQLHNLIPTMTARENVEIPMMARAAGRAARRSRATELLDRVGLASRLDFAVTKLSGGERQRVAIARALANRPRILLGDEPTGSLDTTTGAEVIDLLVEVQIEAGATLVLVTHDHDVAARMDRVIELRDGLVERDSGAAPGTGTAELLEASA